MMHSLLLTGTESVYLLRMYCSYERKFKMNVGVKLQYKLLLTLLFSGLAVQVFSQEETDDYPGRQYTDSTYSMYMPVLSIGYGALNFIGDVRSSSILPVVGNPAYRLNVSTFIDQQHYFAANFYFLSGSLRGEQQSVTDLSQNLNFTSNIYSIGITMRYDFGHLFNRDMKLRPYAAAGVGHLLFNSKGDLYDAQNRFYFYWPDGTIRSIPSTETGPALPLQRDYLYETDLRSFESESYGLGDYNQRSFSIPFEIGFSLQLSDRVAASLGTEYHYTFTDFIDNVAAEGTNMQGNKGNDGFFFTHFTMHFDLFSNTGDQVDGLDYLDPEMEAVFFGDEDGDLIPDVEDHCPGTPAGVLVDTLGCPIDRDNDGVPDYLDEEPDSEYGAWVNEQGISIGEEEFLAQLHRDTALNREDLERYMQIIRDRFVERSVVDIPEKFVELDTDEDGYISFEELLKVIDEYFDFEVDLSLEELRQVNEFFFSQ